MNEKYRYLIFTPVIVVSVSVAESLYLLVSVNLWTFFGGVGQLKKCKHIADNENKQTADFLKK